MAAFQANEDALASLSDDVDGLWCRPIAIIDYPPDPFVFLRGRSTCITIIYIVVIII